MGNGFCMTKTYHKPKINESQIVVNDNIPQNNDLKNDIKIVKQEIDTIKTTVTELKQDFDSKFPKETKIPVAECFEVYHINGQEVTIPYDTSPLDKMRILSYYDDDMKKKYDRMIRYD